MYTKKIVNLTASKAMISSNLGLLQRVVVVSLGETNIDKDTFKTISKAELSSISATGETKKVLEAFFSVTDKHSVTVLDMAAVSIDPETMAKKIERLKALIADESVSGYLYVLPKEFLAEPTISDFVTEYNDVNKMSYFVMPVAYGTDLTSNADVERVKNMKSVILVYEQLDSSNLNATGIFAGSYVKTFNISLTNKMRAFDYLYINANIKDITKTTAGLLEKNSIVYFGNIIGKPGFLNVKCMDAEDFTYYIAYDNMSIRIVDRITNRLVNANNKFNSGITYDDNGIISLKANIEDELTNCTNLGLLSEFGASYNETDMAIEELNEISYIPVKEYIKTQPDDYKKNAYNGFSFECRISKFVLTVSINANLY